MLVLSRKVLESILIGKDVVITIVEARSGKVRVAITAPRDVEVLRAEIADSADERLHNVPRF